MLKLALKSLSLGFFLYVRVLLLDFFSFEEEEWNKMDDEVHLANTLGSRNELLNHFDITVNAFVKMHARERLIRVLNCMH